METQLEVERGNKLHAYRQELLTLCSTAVNSAYRMGEIMKEVRDDELWRGAYQSFDAFYSDPELGFEKSSVYRAIKMVENFTLEEVGHVPLGKLNVILPHITKENKQEMVRMAESLSRSDLQHQLVVKRLATEIPKIEYFPKVYPCKVCHKLKGVSWEGLCHCGMNPKQVEIISKLIEKIELGEEFEEEEKSEEMEDNENY